MNVFFLSRDPQQSATWLVDRHVIKMILESAQMLATAHRIFDSSFGMMSSRTDLPKATHKNHPCSVWARQTSANYLWLANHAIALSDEYTFRYDKLHKYKINGLLDWLANNLPSGLLYTGESITVPAVAMPEEYKRQNVTIKLVEKLYRHYYANKKSHLHSWKKRNPPEWINEYKDAEIPVH